MAPNDEQDPAMERDLRGYYRDLKEDLLAPVDLWHKMEDRLGKQKNAPLFPGMGWSIFGGHGIQRVPALAVGGFVVAMLVTGIWYVAADNMTSTAIPYYADDGTNEQIDALRMRLGDGSGPRRVEVTRIVRESAEERVVEVTRVVEAESMIVAPEGSVQGNPDVYAYTVSPTSVPQPAGVQGPQGSQGQWSSTRGTSEVQPNVPPPNTSFADHGRQSFVSAREDNVSTFSLDTDRTSYQLALNWARNGYEIDPTSVRAEEWVNAFNYDYELPRNDWEFAVTSEVIQHPLDADLHLARVSFQAPVVPDDTPLNVTLVLDASGSMAQGNRVDITREAAHSIRESLGPKDRIAVVHFTNDVIHNLTVPHSDPDTGPVGWSIDRLEPQGSTNVQAGLDLGVRLADQARRDRPDAHNYIILMSDGVANVDATDPFAILESAYDRDSRNPLRIIAIGVGIENYNDDLLEKLAQHGNGWYRYLQDTDQARSTFNRENWLAISTPFADQTRAQVTWDTEVVDSWRIVGYENRVTPDHTFTQDRKEFAELPSGTATTVFYELDLRRDVNPDRWHDLGSVDLRWVEPGSGESRSQHANVSGRPGVSFEAVHDPLLRLGAVVALAADRYSSLDEGYSNPAWVASDMLTLNDLMASLRRELGSLQAYEDVRFLMEHMLVGIDHFIPSPTPPTGYSR